MTDYGKVLYDATHAVESSKQRYSYRSWEERSESRQDEYRQYANAVVESLLHRMIADAGEYQLCLEDAEGNYGVEVDTLRDWLNHYKDDLPTATESEANDHE